MDNQTNSEIQTKMIVQKHPVCTHNSQEKQST